MFLISKGENTGNSKCPTNGKYLPWCNFGGMLPQIIPSASYGALRDGQ
jgi:hypothetical protein